MSNSTKTIRSFKSNTVVVWREGMRPTAHAHARGTVFMSKGRETFVVWDGETRPQLVFTGALVKA